jgi:hypothetical protein
MIVSRRRLSTAISGVLLVSAVATGAFQTATAAAAPDATACIAALRTDRDGAIHLSNSWLAAFNATATGTPLATADAKYIAALKASRDAYYKAYQYAYKGQKTLANAWIKKGNAAIARANAAVKVYNAEIAKINAKADAADVESATLATQMDATDETCAGL